MIKETLMSSEVVGFTKGFDGYDVPIFKAPDFIEVEDSNEIFDILTNDVKVQNHFRSIIYKHMTGKELLLNEAADELVLDKNQMLDMLFNVVDDIVTSARGLVWFDDNMFMFYSDAFPVLKISATPQLYSFR